MESGSIYFYKVFLAMAAIVLTVNSNWSTCSDGNNTGVAPAAGDSIYLNTFTLTLDTAGEGATYTCVLIRASVSDINATASSGSIVPPAATAYTLDCSLTEGTTTLLIIASGKHVTVTGTANGGPSPATNKTCLDVQNGGFLDGLGTASGGSSVSNVGVVVRAGGTATITNAIGGTGIAAFGINNFGTATVTNATGGSVANAHGVSATTSGGVTTITNATGGSASEAHGFKSFGNMTATITTAKGGSNAGAHGVVCVGTGVVTVNNVDTSGTGQPVAVPGLRMASGTHISAADTAGTWSKFRIEADVAAATDVRDGVGRWTGATGGDVGTLAVGTTRAILGSGLGSM